jgi:hypothetical protein
MYILLIYYFDATPTKYYGPFENMNEAENYFSRHRVEIAQKLHLHKDYIQYSIKDLESPTTNS